MRTTEKNTPTQNITLLSDYLKKSKLKIKETKYAGGMVKDLIFISELFNNWIFKICKAIFYQYLWYQIKQQKNNAASKFFVKRNFVKKMVKMRM